MTTQDSPVPWVRDHVRAYVETDGRTGHHLMGETTLVLTTTGRRSGIRRRNGATYGKVGDDYVIIASDGGNARTPQWVLNLVTDPHVEVQVGADRFHATARVTTGPERDRLWHFMVARSPIFADLQARTTREFPVVILYPKATAA